MSDFEFERVNTIKGYPELHWTGKRPYRGTDYYPAQLKEKYGEMKDDWINKIFWGDNLQVMSHMLKEYRGKIDLIYIDPPFDSNADYKKSIKLKGKKIQNDNKIQNVQIGLFRLEIADFSEKVFQEALLNALSHRDYQQNCRA